MRAVVIGNGTIRNYEYMKKKLRSGDFIICADGGLRHARAMGISPDIAIGDFDSSEKDDSVRSYVYPARKDFTDGELAVAYAAEQGYDEILLIGMTGDRLDHTLSDIFLMSRYPGTYLADDKNDVYILHSSLTICGCRGKTLSIIPICGDLCGITTSGLEWQLENDTLYFGTSRGNSNVIINESCTISVNSGTGLVIVNDGE